MTFYSGHSAQCMFSRERFVLKDTIGVTMTKQNSARDARSDNQVARASASDALDRLRAQIDIAAESPEPSSEQMASIDAWMHRLVTSGVLREAPLSQTTLDILTEVLPEASVTSDLRARVERARLAVRAAMLEAQRLEEQCSASSPAELFRFLRERAGVSVERSAELFGVGANTWIAVERSQAPWYRLRAESIPAFAAAVAEPVEQLVALITLTARRAVLAGVERRAHRALGRFDEGQAATESRRDHLRMAFARVAEENQGAATFLHDVRRLTGDLPENETVAPAPRTSTKGR